MNTYGKIKTVFERDPQTKMKTLIERRWAVPEFEYLQDLDWVWTEKVDGTNVRIHWDSNEIQAAGRTDTAQMPPFLIWRLLDLFTPDRMEATFPELGVGASVILFGEGYGARIQKGGGNYIPDGVDFVLFDVLMVPIASPTFYLERVNVQDIAEKLQIEVVPIVGVGPLLDAIALAREGFDSWKGTARAEGLVMRPYVELRTRMGDRIITKIKTKGFTR